MGQARRFAILIWGMLSLLALSACDVPRRAPAEATAQEGTRALILRGGREFESIITEVVGKYVSSELRWQGQQVLLRRHYRGLFPLSGSESVRDNGESDRFELELDEGTLESFFPLEVGKTLDVAGVLHLVNQGEVLRQNLQAKVIGKRVLDLDGSSEEVFVIEIRTTYENPQVAGARWETAATVSYSEKYSMILKYVLEQNGQQNFWRVISIAHGDAKGEAQRQRRRRRGTVAI